MGGMSPWARRRLRRGGGGARRPPAAKSDDLDALKKTVDDAASVGGGLWFSYLFVMFYLAVAAGAVTHADLFFEKPVKLPFLAIELPLLAFFALAPFLFLIVHAYTLLHLVMLTEKAKRYDEALYEKLGGEASKAKRDALRGQLPSNVFVQFLAGPPRMRDGLFGTALRGVAWLTLVVGPVLLLLLLQLQFLPYHSSPITWAHRIALILDLGLIWWLWRKIFTWGEGDAKRWWTRWNWSATGVAVSGIAVVFSVVIATYHGEPRPDLIADLDKGNWVPAVHEAIFNSKVDSLSGRRWLPLSDTLVLSNVNSLVELGIDDPKKAEWRDFIFRAAGRRLEGAIFDHALMGRIDFGGAHLNWAKMIGAQLDRASFNGAEMQGASLEGASLQGASLDSAELQDASLVRAQLQGASLSDARLQGASLDSAQLQGASLYIARLQGASLDGAQLQGASLQSAHFQGAYLHDARLQGASLNFAELQGASLNYAQLQGASLDTASIKASDFDGAFLWRTQLLAVGDEKLSLSEERINWGPFFTSGVPWNQAAYEALRKQMEALPMGDLRDFALKRIQTLDCADAALPTCEPPKTEAPLLQPSKTFATWGVPRDAFRKALAETLASVGCQGDDQTIYVVRGPGFRDLLRVAGAEAKSLVDDLLDNSNTSCPVAAMLSTADRSSLAEIEAGWPRSPSPPAATPLTPPPTSPIDPPP